MPAERSVVSIVSDGDPERRRRIAALLALRLEGHVVENDRQLEPVEAAAFVHFCGPGTTSDHAPLEQLAALLEDGCAPLCLGHVVTVVEPAALWSAVRTADDFSGPEPGVTAVERLVEQLEWSTLVVVAGPAEGQRAAHEAGLALIALLAPSASAVSLAALTAGRVVPPPVPVEALRRVRRAPGWIGELGGRRALRLSSEVPLGTVVFRDPRPFHPGRLGALVEQFPQRVGDVVRSRGLVTLATRAERALSWSSVGEVLGLSPTPADLDLSEVVTGQELVLYGLSLETRRVTSALAECLLTPSELLAGPRAWARYSDPFPTGD